MANPPERCPVTLPTSQDKCLGPELCRLQTTIERLMALVENNPTQIDLRNALVFIKKYPQCLNYEVLKGEYSHFKKATAVPKEYNDPQTVVIPFLKT